MTTIIYVLIGLILWFPLTFAILKVGFHEWDWGFAIWTLIISLIGWPFLLAATPFMLLYMWGEQHKDTNPDGSRKSHPHGCVN